MASTAPIADHNASNNIVNDTSAKRKREEETSAPAADIAPASQHTQQVQRDLLSLLEIHDTTPSLLHHALARNATGNEPSQKKARLSGTDDVDVSIAAKMRSGGYASLLQIKLDAHAVSEELVASIRGVAREKESTFPDRLSVGELKSIRRIQALETMIGDLIEKESDIEDARQEQADIKKEPALVNGQVPERTANARQRTSGAVLTLFGNAPTPKQLFSSMQKAQISGQGIKSELPVEEMSLPNGIHATTVVPTAVDSSIQGPTIEEAFAPPYSLAALTPPKAQKRSTTAETTLTWEYKDPIKRNKRGGYTVQPLTTGTWLGYGGVDPAGDSTIAREKRKLRDRALSTGESTHQEMHPHALEEALTKEEEALFRKAYSSFAPTVDNANSMVPTETKNMVWWHKTGSKRFNETFALDPALADGASSTALPQLAAKKQESLSDPDFSRLIEDLDGLDQMEQIQDEAKSKTDVDQVLSQIYGLLESLASYQRIRNASLPSSMVPLRAPISPGPMHASITGTPDKPSELEISTYESLRREIAYLVLKLPPYAVAKLDGYQLAKLGVNTLIKFQAKDTRGIMEEDQVSRSARIAALATANSIAALTRPNSSAGQHYNTTAQRTPAIGQAANTRYGQQYGARTPATQPQYQRSTSNQGTYGTPSATAPRATYTQPSQYTRPGAPQPGYGQTNAQQYYQRPAQQTTGGYSGYGSQYQASSQLQRSQYAPTSYQPNASASQTSYNRIASPANTTSYGSPMPASLQQAGQTSRPGMPPQPPSSGRVTPSNYPSQPHTPVNGYPPPRQPSAVAPRPASTTPQPSQALAPPPLSGTQTNGTS